MFIAGDSQQQYAIVKADGRNEYSRLMVESFLYAVERGYTELKPRGKRLYLKYTDIVIFDSFWLMANTFRAKHILL
mgnify:FL=1